MAPPKNKTVGADLPKDLQAPPTEGVKPEVDETVAEVKPEVVSPKPYREYVNSRGLVTREY